MNEIWFIHDMQSNPGLRRTALERAGWTVRATTSATEALTWFRESAPSLCVIDVLLEGRTGFDLCLGIREMHSAEAVPIVMGCSIYQDPEHAVEAERVGAQRYLALPVEPESLVVTVAELARDRPGVRAA